MREIKFRALCEVEYKDCASKNMMTYFSQLELDNGLWYNPDDKNIYHINEWLSKPMQYTGLKDKNDKEIYEGDIVKFYNGIININIETGVIVFDSLMCYIDTKKRETGDFITNYEKDELEVIGNIHENPELVK